MDSSQSEQAYIELRRILLINNMCQASSITWLVYDFLVTFDREVEYIWKKPKTRLSTFLYILLRYLGSVLGLFASTVFFVDKPSLADYMPIYYFVWLTVITTVCFMIPSCEVFVRMESWTTWPIVCIVQALLQMRLYALYMRSNKILGFMIVLFLAEVSVQFYTYISFDSKAQVTNQPLPGVYLCGPTTYGLVIYSYQHSKVRFSGLQWNRAHMIDILVQGNVLYYFGSTLVLVLSAVIEFAYGSQWGPAANTFARATFIIGGCHLTLHLLEASFPVLHSTQQPSAGPIFAYPTSTMSYP